LLGSSSEGLVSKRVFRIKSAIDDAASRAGDGAGGDALFPTATDGKSVGFKRTRLHTCTVVVIVVIGLDTHAFLRALVAAPPVLFTPVCLPLLVSPTGAAQPPARR
jgi:hypothetical protein